MALEIRPERRRQWCRPVDPDFLRRLNTKKPKTMEALAQLWYNDRDWRYHAHEHYDSSRYHLLNLHSVFQKGTIEFRAFNSTLHAGKVKAYTVPGHLLPGPDRGLRQPPPPGNRQPQVHFPVLAPPAGLYRRRIQDCPRTPDQGPARQLRLADGLLTHSFQIDPPDDGLWHMPKRSGLGASREPHSSQINTRRNTKCTKTNSPRRPCRTVCGT